MGIHTYTLVDITSPVSPNRMFQALVVDNHNFSKHMPKFVKSIEFVHGDSTVVGSVKKINLPEGSPFKYVKNRIDEIDNEKCYVKYTTIEGDVLRDILECVVYEVKFEASSEGCHVTLVGHYHTKGDVVVKEEEIAGAKLGITRNIKAVEEYLIANPQVYA